MWFKSTRPKEDYEDILTTTAYDLTFGPFASFTLNWAKGLELMVEEGKIYRGAEYMMPGMIKEPMEAVRLAREGFVTLAGDKITEAQYYQGWRFYGQAMGFTNIDVQKSQDVTFLVNDMVAKGRELRTELLQDHTEAARLLIDMVGEMNGDLTHRLVRRKIDDLEKIREEIVAYNWKYFYEQIPNESLEESLSGTLERAGLTLEGVYLPDKIVPFIYPIIRDNRVYPLPLPIEN